MTVSTTQLDEVSSITAALGKDKNVQRMMRYLHTQKEAPHDLKFMPIGKDDIDWAAFKKLRAWLLFKCDKGIAAIRRAGSYNDYTLILSNDAWVDEPSETDPETGEVTTAIVRAQDAIDNVVSCAVKLTGNNDLIELNIDRKDEILRAIRTGVGKIKETYVAKVTDAQQNKVSSRSISTAASNKGGGTVEALVKKFKPILIKAATQADAELSGVVGIAIKAKAYDRADKIIRKLKMISKILSDTERSHADLLTEAVRYAVGMTAVREFNVTDARTGGWSERITVEVSAGDFNAILARAARGDGKIIGEILYYFKRYIMLVK